MFGSKNLKICPPVFIDFWVRTFVLTLVTVLWFYVYFTLNSAVNIGFCKLSNVQLKANGCKF